MEMNLGQYKEKKAKRIRLICWRVIEKATCLLPNALRVMLLRLFGAKIGKRCLICRGARFYAPWNFECGDFVCIGPRVEVYCKDKVIMGNQIVISQDSYLCTASHNIYSSVMELETAPIRIEDNTWIAARATILPGVLVGKGAVVGACAVVASEVQPGSVMAGNPARLIGCRGAVK